MSQETKQTAIYCLCAFSIVAVISMSISYASTHRIPKTPGDILEDCMSTESTRGSQFCIDLIKTIH